MGAVVYLLSDASAYTTGAGKNDNIPICPRDTDQELPLARHTSRWRIHRHINLDADSRHASYNHTRSRRSVKAFLSYSII